MSTPIGDWWKATPDSKPDPRRKRGYTPSAPSDVAIGNVIGSNFFNVLAVLGLNALAVPLPIAPEIATGDNLWMLGVTLGLFPHILTGRRISRFEGILLLAVYGLYLSLLLAH